MIKKLISGAIAICLVIAFCFKKSEYKTYTEVSKEDILKLYNKNLTSIGPSAFSQYGVVQYILGNKLAQLGHAEMSLFGPIAKSQPTPEYIELLIESPGGSVDVLYNVLQYMDSLRKKNYRFKCYVAEAQSAAFTFMLKACDIRTYVRGAKITQHRAYYIGTDKQKMEDVGTQIESLNMADIEAKVLKISFKKWYNISRSEDLKEFTLEELYTYGIIHGEF